MKSQLLHVFKTYWTRPLILVLAAIVFLATLGLLSQAFSGNVQSYFGRIAPEIPRPHPYLSVSLADFKPPLSGPRGKPLRTLSLVSFDQSQLPDLTTFTELRTLELQLRELDGESISRILTLPKLQTLILHTTVLPAGLLSALGPQLHQLSIPSAVLRQHAGELEQLTSLSVLVVDRSDWSQEAFSAIARIPHLKYLVLRPEEFAARWNADPVKRDVSAPLQVPSTQALLPLLHHSSLLGVFSNWTGPLRDVHGQAIDIPVYPRAMQQRQITTIILGLLIVFLVMVAVGSHLGTQMLMPTALTIPGFLGPHVTVAVLLMSAGLLVTIGGMASAGIGFLPAAGYVLSVPIVASSMLLGASLTMTQERRSHPVVRALQTGMGALLGSLFFLPQVLAFALPPHLKGEFTWFTEGAYPGWAGLLVGIEIAMIASWFRGVKRWARRFQENVPQATVVNPWSREWQEQVRAQYSPGRQSRQLESRLQQLRVRPLSFWQQVNLLRLGNTPRPTKQIVGMMVGVIFVMGVFGKLSSGEELDDYWSFFQAVFSRDAVKFWLPMAVVQTMVYLGIAPLTSWSKRMQTFELEVCRPISRRELVKQLFGGLALEQSWALVPVSMLAIGGILSPREGGNVQESYGFAAILLAGCLLAYATSTLLFACQRIWVFVATASALLVPLIFGVTACVVLLGMGGNQIVTSPVPLMLIAIVILGAAVAVLVYSYRRTLKREWN